MTNILLKTQRQIPDQNRASYPPLNRPYTAFHGDMSQSILDDSISKTLERKGFVFIPGEGDYNKLGVHWEGMPEDTYLLDTIRQRRYRVAHLENETLSLLSNEPHLQSGDFNILFGDIKRSFDPIPDFVFSDPTLLHILYNLTYMLPRRFQAYRLQIHQFRIVAPGDPTPEGLHQDGADYVFMMLINRNNIKGGETRLVHVNQPKVQHDFILQKPGDALIVNDQRFSHYVSPITTADHNQGIGFRDMLVITFHSDASRL